MQFQATTFPTKGNDMLKLAEMLQATKTFKAHPVN